MHLRADTVAALCHHRVMDEPDLPLFADQDPEPPPKVKPPKKPACPDCRSRDCDERGGAVCDGVRKWWAHQRDRLQAMLAEARAES